MIFRSLRAFLRGIKNALILLIKCDWHEFIIRLRISLGHVDLKQDPEEYLERSHYYVDSGGLEFDKILADFDITPSDAILDFGCGKGGILISLSKYPFSKITGVEIAPDIVEIAQNNMKKLNITNVNIVCCDAADFRNLDEYNYFYFFNPFPCIVMKDVLHNIEESLKSHHRQIIIIYLNPLCHDLIVSGKVFFKLKELPHFLYKCFIYSNIKETTKN